MFLTTVVLAPVLEETVFRGFLLPSLTKWMGTGSAVVVSTVIFGTHWAFPNPDPVYCPSLTVLLEQVH